MKILSDNEYAYYKAALEESKELVEDVYSSRYSYNLGDITPMIAAVFLKVSIHLDIHDSDRVKYFLDQEKEQFK